MRHAGKIGLWITAAIIVLPLLLAVFVLTFDWNRAKPWLNDKVSQAAARPFEMTGDLQLRWRRQESGATGWRAYIPWPHFSAEQVRMGNVAWSKTGQEMAQVGRVEFSINPLLLPARRIAIPTIILKQPQLLLERDGQGRNNWTFPKSKDDGRWQLELGRIQLDDGRVRLVDADRRADITVELNSLDQPDPKGYQLRWTVKGKLDNDSVTGKGQSGHLLALREQDQPYPFDAELRVGRSRLAATGNVSRPRSKPTVDVRLDLSGQSMADLTPITTVLLPETSRFATQGHLKGQMNEHGGNWLYENFSGRMGQSDIAGTLTYNGGRPRPTLQGSLHSRQLRFEDLGSLIGSRPDGEGPAGDRDAARKQARRERTGRVLPDKRFRTERWRTLDADVKFRAQKILRSEDLPIQDLDTHLHLKDGLLRLDPLNFGVAGGKLGTRIELDGRAQPMKADLKLDARGLQLRQLFPAAESMHASVGAVNGEARLTGTGDSIAALLGSANGELRALMEKGSISKFVLEAMGLNVGSVVLTKLFGDRQVKINCMASDFAIEQGVMKTRLFVLDTDDAVINVTGQINLAREQLDLVINPESRNMRLFSLRSPLYVNGSFRKPDIGVDKVTVAAKAGGALALGILAPVATALLPLVNAGGGEDSGCNPLLQQAKKPTQAPKAR